MTRSLIRCSASLVAPLHLIGLMSAVRHYHGPAGTEIQVFVNWPGGERQTIEAITAAIGRMATAFPEIRSVTPVFNEDLAELYRTEGYSAGRVAGFRARYQLAPFAEIYYPFDVVGEVYPLLAAANPAARRICIGENLGHLLDRDLYFSLLPPADPAAAASSSLARRARRRLGIGWRAAKQRFSRRPAPAKPTRYPPHEAALLLPIDQSAGLLRHIPLTIPARGLAVEITRQAGAACTELDAYCGDLLETHQGTSKYILCTQNFAEAKFIAFDQEIAMWAAILRRHCAPGATIFHKPHPAGLLPRGAAIAEAVGADYRWVELDPRFTRFPIEIWRRLVMAAIPVSGSNPILTLRYLHGVEGIQPFEAALVDRWFPPEFRPFMQNAICLFAEPLAAYRTWDGASVLWTAPPLLRRV